MFQKCHVQQGAKNVTLKSMLKRASTKPHKIAAEKTENSFCEDMGRSSEWLQANVTPGLHAWDAKNRRGATSKARSEPTGRATHLLLLQDRHALLHPSWARAKRSFAPLASAAPLLAVAPQIKLLWLCTILGRT